MEVLGIMMTLFSDEYLNRALIKEQQEEGALKAQKKNVQRLHAKGFSNDDIADMLDLKIEDVSEWITESQLVTA